jgi:hypothetical protein
MRTWRWVLLIVAFVAVHAWLWVLNIAGPGRPFVDVTGVYLNWVRYGIEQGIWVGLDGPFVYPIAALIPMVMAWIGGAAGYGHGWLLLVTVLDAVALGVVLRWGRAPERLGAAFWWIAFLLLIGPIALGRIDAVTVALSIMGLAVLIPRPLIAGLILGLATWIKVWPAVLIAAVLIVARPAVRLRVLLGVLSITAGIMVTALALGGGSTLFSFLTAQSDRGLQIEAPVSTIWMWMTFAGVPGTEVFYSRELLTMQVVGPGSDIAVMLATPLMVVALLAIGILAVRAVRHGAHNSVLAPLSLGFIASLLFFNKVGSPQFATWLAVPVIAGLVIAAERGGVAFRLPAALVLLVAVLTQLIYPTYYTELVQLNVPMLLVLTVRNVLYLVLLIWSIRHVALAARRSEDGILTA